MRNPAFAIRAYAVSQSTFKATETALIAQSPTIRPVGFGFVYTYNTTTSIIMVIKKDRFLKKGNGQILVIFGHKKRGCRILILHPQMLEYSVLVFVDDVFDRGYRNIIFFSQWFVAHTIDVAVFQNFSIPRGMNIFVNDMSNGRIGHSV